MKNVFFNLIVPLIFLASCTKKEDICNSSDSTIIAPASETANVQSYLTTNNLTATQHPSGVFYKITQTGTGNSIVNLCSTVTVRYAGRLTSGTYFDPPTAGATSTASFALGQVIVGWQKTLPLISSGGKIILYIPPSLGYGNVDVKDKNNVVVIPANSILIFEIELLNVS